MKKPSPKKLSIIIPVRNEGINISILLKILMAIVDFQHEVLVVYDSANDDTIPVVKRLQKKYPQVRLVHNRLGKGVGNAIKAGIKGSTGEFVLIFAADEVGPVLAIEDMLFLLKKGCDLVSCTRYAHGGRRLGGSLIQALLSRVGNSLFHEIVGTTLTDSTTGIKMFKRRILESITLESQVGWAVVFELAIKAQLRGMKLGEVPIVSIDRLYGGESSFKIRPWMKEYVRWFIYGIKHLRPAKKKHRVLVRIPQSTV